MSDNFSVVTGGPGAGKTSLITELARRGFHTIPESGRAIILEKMQSGGDAPPLDGSHGLCRTRMLDSDLRPTAPHSPQAPRPSTAAFPTF